MGHHALGFMKWGYFCNSVSPCVGTLKAMAMELLEDTMAPAWRKPSMPGWLSYRLDQDLIPLHLSYHWTAAETVNQAD